MQGSQQDITTTWTSLKRHHICSATALPKLRLQMPNGYISNYFHVRTTTCRKLWRMSIVALWLRKGQRTLETCFSKQRETTTNPSSCHTAHPLRTPSNSALTLSTNWRLSSSAWSTQSRKGRKKCWRRTTRTSPHLCSLRQSTKLPLWVLPTCHLVHRHISLLMTTRCHTLQKTQLALWGWWQCSQNSTR